MEEILLDFPEHIRRILKDLLENEDDGLILHPNGKDLTIENRFDTCYSWKLTLADVSGLPEQVEDGSTFWCNGLDKVGDRYVLKGYMEYSDAEESQDVERCFSGVSVEYAAHRANMGPNGMKPWAGLSILAYGIVRKHEVVPQLMNDRELALLPLLKEITMLGYWLGIPEEVSRSGLPHLRQLLDSKLHRFLDRVEQSAGTWKLYWKAANMLLAQLNRSEYEPIWRKIYNEIAASQDEYPVRTYTSAELRRKIENLFHSWGYSGKYPDFIKTGEVKGLHVQDSHGMSYFVFNEKNAVFHIHCQEYPGWQDAVQIEFLCGTEFLKQGEQPGDIWSCTFDAKGRRLIHSVSCFCEEDLLVKATIAVKKAELLKLTKEERMDGGSANLLRLFLMFFLFAGGFFAVFWTLGFSLLTMLITGIVAGWSEIPEMLHTMPWIEMIIMSWLGFGGAMGIVCVIAERNK